MKIWTMTEDAIVSRPMDGSDIFRRLYESDLFKQHAMFHAGEHVVRLEDVDAMLAEAVWAMEIIKAVFVVYDDECQLRAQAFLSSQVVTDWKKRQKGTSSG